MKNLLVKSAYFNLNGKYVLILRRCPCCRTPSFIPLLPYRFLCYRAGQRVEFALVQGKETVKFLDSICLTCERSFRQFGCILM